MGLFRRQKVEYFYLEKNLKGNTLKYGPFTFEQMATVYKESQIAGDTYIWTNEKCFVDDKGRPARAAAWTMIGDMPEEWQEKLEEAAATANDRRQKMNTGETSFGTKGSGMGPPPVPML
ncbi:hypothetical protein NDN08_000963 [Rhodosorus marinus]|uniref:GYF domain-containing protein n=1 Tax=Rhodosorus marinus TaxID=101924 RepID=A0AAV8UPG2_9RHOD|nr:hypothetical protein NDN08_000963 [Rhodosorus marinus]